VAVRGLAKTSRRIKIDGGSAVGGNIQEKGGGKAIKSTMVCPKEGTLQTSSGRGESKKDS